MTDEPISADQFNRAVLRSAKSRTQLAAELGVNRSYLYELMKTGINSRPLIQRAVRVLGLELRDESGNPLQGFETVAILRELSRRFEELEAERAALEGSRPDEDMTDIGQSDHGSDTDVMNADVAGETGRRSRGSHPTTVGTRRRVASGDVAKGIDRRDDGEQDGAI